MRPGAKARGRRLFPFVFAAAAAVGCAPGKGDPLGPSVNHAPVIRSVTLVPDRVPLGGTSHLSVDAIDPDGDALFYKYSADSGTITIPDASTPNQAVYVQNGAARLVDRITVTVVDRANAATSVTSKISLQGNQPPTVTLAWVNGGKNGGGTCHPECSITLRADASDPEGDALSYNWSGCTSGNEQTARCTIESVGAVTASVVVSDGHGGLATAAVEAQGVNAAPNVSGGRTLSGPHATLAVSASDPDGDALDCGWTGTCTCTGSTGSYNLTCDVPGGAGSCGMRFACTDVFGAGAETDFTVLP